MITLCVGFLLLYGSEYYIEPRSMFDSKLLQKKIDCVKNLNKTEIKDMLIYAWASLIVREFIQTKKRYSAEKFHHVQEIIKINPKEVISFCQIVLKREFPICTWCVTFSKNAPEFLNPVDFLYAKEEERDAMVYIGNLMNEEFEKLELPLIEVNSISSALYNSIVIRNSMWICFYSVKVPDGYYTLIKQDVFVFRGSEKLAPDKEELDEPFKRYKDGTYDRQPGFGGSFTGMDWYYQEDMDGNNFSELKSDKPMLENSKSADDISR